MNLNRLHEILHETTKEFRKGEAIQQSDLGVVHVTKVYDMPPVTDASAALEKVDVHFMVVCVDKSKAALYKDEIITILKDYPNSQELAGGPSFIVMGFRLESQDAALRLFALGKVLGLWDIITPATMHITGPQADELAGSGFVMIAPPRPKKD